MRVLVVDAFDSFVYIVRQYLVSAGTDPVVVRSNELRDGGPGAVAALAPDAIVLGPGPGHPAESGHVEIVARHGGALPILGICLGHQAIGLAHGATVRPAEHLMHGKASPVTHTGTGVFAGMPQPFQATRYHSLIVLDRTLPPELEVTARARDDGYVMGLRHRWQPTESVQFHPESVGTEQGMRMMTNFVSGAAHWSGAELRAAG